MEASKALCLAFSALSCSISLLKASIRVSKSGSRRQLSIDKNCRQRGNDENDAPLLLEREVSTGEGDVVIGGEQRDEADDQASEGLQPAKPIKARPGTQEIGRFWRIRRLLAGAALRIGHGLGRCHKVVGTTGGGIADPPLSSATNTAWCPIGHAQGGAGASRLGLCPAQGGSATPCPAYRTRVGLAAGQEDLDGLGGTAQAALASGTRPRTSIWPVTAAEIRAERRSDNSSIDREA